MGEYVIIEHDGILLTWVSHIALGAESSGRCFVVGNILVIGPKGHEGAGLLKLEFHEQLMKLPIWFKTAYYCFASSIRKVGTAQSIMPELIENTYINKMGKKIETGNFRLGRYKITVEENGVILWQTSREQNKIISGKGITESGILFLEPKEIENEKIQGRREFFAVLKLLPRWNYTSAWGHYGSLMPCKEAEPQRRPCLTIWKQENVKAHITKKMLLPRFQQPSKEGFREFSESGSEWLKTTWRHIVEWKIWSRLALLVIAGVLMGLGFIVFLIGKFSSKFLSILNRFRANHKE